MGQTICSYSSYGGGGGGGSSSSRTTATTYSCQFVEWRVLSDMFERDRYGLYIVHGVGLFLIAFLWLLSCLIRYKDYTRSFVMANLIPLTVYALSSLVTLITGHYDGSYSYYNPFSMTDYLVRSISLSTFWMTLPLTLIAFQIMNLQMARKRRETKCCYFFFAVPIILAVIYSVIYFVPGLSLNNVDYYVMHGVIFVLGIVNFINLCALCCCSSPRAGMASVPSVANARSRMGWSILFAIVAMFPINLILSVEQLYRTIYVSGAMAVIWHIMQLTEAMVPIFFCVGALLLLPAYRSVFCCSQGYEKNKIGDTQIVIQMKAEDLAANFNSMQKLAVPNGSQSSSPYLNQKEALPDFGAVLTNPPNVTTYAVPPPPPPPAAMLQTPLPHLHIQSPVPQQCNCNHGVAAMPAYPVYAPPPTLLPVEQYQYVQQHPVISHQLASSPVVSSPVQGGLVRWASQPNLAPMQTLQSAMSVPQLNMVPQSPFYIHN